MSINPMTLQDRTILVTGASSGIGRETAILLSELGARVILAGRDRDRLEETRNRMQNGDHRVECFDLCQADSIPEWVKRIVSEVGPLHGLVHSAGIHRAAGIQMANTARIDAVMHSNVTTAIMLTKALRQKGCAARGGSLVLLSSVAGLAGQAGISIYSASKAALMGFVRSAALELAPEGLRVNCVAPGYVDTEMAQRFREVLTDEQYQAIQRMHPLGIGQPRDVANAIAFLLAETGRWITGSTLVLDGGYTAH